MATHKKMVVRTTRLTLLGYGFFIGLFFPLFYNLVLAHQSPIFFWLSCIGAGLLIGWLSFVVLRIQILSRLRTLNLEIQLMQLRQQFHPLQHNFHPQDLFAELLNNFNSLLNLGQEQYNSAYRSAIQLIGDRFKFNRRIREFNNRLQTLNQALGEIDQQVQQQQGQSRQQLDIFLEMNRSIQQAAASLSSILEQSAGLEVQLKKQDSHVQSLLQESQDIEAAAAGAGHGSQDKAILELSLSFASENDRALSNQEERLEQIATLLQDIEDIAESTHLLSINASIEAARAGEAGRGFTIVALQIRNLATKASSLTAAIREQIDGITQLARSSSYALGDLRELMNNKNQELQESFARVREVSQQSQELRGELQPLYRTIRGELEQLSDKMIQLNHIRDRGRQELDEQQAVYRELRQKMTESRNSFLTLKEIGEKGLFNEDILRQFHENIRSFEAVSQHWGQKTERDAPETEQRIVLA